MFLSPRWEGDLERDDCASSSNSSVTEEGLSDTVDREAFPRKEGESMHTGFGPRGSKSNFTTISPPWGKETMPVRFFSELQD